MIKNICYAALICGIAFTGESCVSQKNTATDGTPVAISSTTNEAGKTKEGHATSTAGLHSSVASSHFSGSRAVQGSDAAQLAGEWVIKSVGDTQIDRDEDYPYIHFVPAEGSFYASNGCNVLNGSFTMKGNVVTFHNVLVTMRYCPDTPFDTQINGVLADDKPVTCNFETVDGLPYLYLSDSHGRRLMTLHKAGLDFLNGDWQVKEINGQKFDNSEMSIFFDVEERKVHGNTGCNSFNGDIYVDPLNSRQLSLSNMAVTMRMCPNMAQQSMFLVALEVTNGVRQGHDGEVYLVDASGNTVITLVPKE